MINVLFICLGNICRSPVAETILGKRIEGAGLSGLSTPPEPVIGSREKEKVTSFCR
ncbi:hypothetical protein [Terribacillus sp. 179-K 1B1 HS]|uniref:arsenate reductase/protein-tyrosine-phosphatase family protein n=1 Tax=Terribacillus sp. 179-K 1B1 HS TaxID=3142388 RepID=UPI0039A1DDE2